MTPFRDIDIARLIYEIGRPDFMLNKDAKLNKFYKFIYCLFYPLFGIISAYYKSRIISYKIAACECGSTQVFEILNDIIDPELRRIKYYEIPRNQYFYPIDYTPNTPRYMYDETADPGKGIFLYEEYMNKLIIAQYPSSFTSKQREMFGLLLESFTIPGFKFSLQEV